MATNWKVKVFAAMLLWVVLLMGATRAGAATEFYSEGFETTPLGGIPNGWASPTSGYYTGVASSAAAEGANSLYMQGAPYFGGEAFRDISSSTIKPGTYNVSFRMLADQNMWSGDGFAHVLFRLNNRSVFLGLGKPSGSYLLSRNNGGGMPGYSFADAPIWLDAYQWNTYSMEFNTRTGFVRFFVNGAYMGSDWAIEEQGLDQVKVAVGGAYYGYPSAYFDSLSITPVQSLLITRRDVGASVITICTVDTAGVNMVPLLSSASYISDPRWSKDRAQLTYVGNSYYSGYQEIFLTDGDGLSPILQLTNDYAQYGNSHPFFRTPSKLWYTTGISYGSSELVEVNTDSSGRQQITNFAASGMKVGTANVSADGTKIVYAKQSNYDASTSELYSANYDLSNETRLTLNGGMDAWPSFSPDGTRIAFMEDTGNGVTDLYVVNADGTNIIKLTALPYFSYVTARPVWSPDGSAIAYSVYDGSQFDVWMMNPDGSNNRNVTSSPMVDELVYDWYDSTPQTPVPGKSYTDPVTGMEFAWVEPGTFQMGSTVGDPDEQPVHTVSLTRGYWLGKYEVTQAQWKTISGGMNPSYNQSSDLLPVEYVSWDSAQAWISSLNASAGLQYRLPSEAEWEFAARGGNRSNGFTYSGSEVPDLVAWYYGGTGYTGQSHAVGGLAPNELGIYDMSGNVWEIVQDYFQSSYYSVSPPLDPVGPATGTYNVSRGGSFYSNYVVGIRIADRNFESTGYSSMIQGFRLALSPVVTLPPDIAQGPSVSVTMAQGDSMPWLAPTLTASDDDTPAAALAWSLATAPASGIATVSGNGAYPTVFTYEPNPGFTGNDSFVVQVSDGTNYTAITVVVTVLAPVWEDFSGDLTGWTLWGDLTGNWTVSNGKLKGYYPQTCSSDYCTQTVAFLPDALQPTVVDYITEVRTSPTPLRDDPSWMSNLASLAYMTDLNNQLYIEVGGRGFGLSGMQSQIYLGIASWNGSYRTWGYVNYNIPFVWDASADHVLKVSKAGSFYHIFFDGAYLYSYFDYILPPTGQIKVGVHVFTEQDFDDFKVTPVDSDNHLALGLDFNGGLVPTNWKTSTTGNGPGLINDRMEALPVDSSAQVFSPTYRPRAYEEIYVKYDGANYFSNFGNGSSVRLSRADGKTYSFHFTNASTWGTDNLHLITQLDQDTTSFQMVKPLWLSEGQYQYELYIHQGSVRYVMTPAGYPYPTIDYTEFVPWLDLSKINGIGFGVQANSDNISWIDNVTVTPTLLHPSRAPYVTNGDAVTVTMSEDGLPLAWTAPTLGAIDGDSPPYMLNWTLATPPAHGTATVSGMGTSPYNVDYRPNASFAGTDSFVVMVSDGVYSDTVTVNVVVNENSVTTLTPGLNYTDPLTGMEFVWVEPGSFMMGDTYGGGAANELPTHQVTLTRGYHIGKFEVTQGQWKAFMGGANPSYFTGNDSLPVEAVTWNDVHTFITNLNAASGRVYRLPTEAEWEYAARSQGQNTKYSGTSSDNDLLNYAWIDANGSYTTHPVGTKSPNGLGIYDMSGNVFEFVQDWYGEYPAGSVIDPTGPIAGTYLTSRGGAGGYGADAARVAWRGYLQPYSQDGFLGFRLLLTDTPLATAPVINQGDNVYATMSEDGSPVAWTAPTLTAIDAETPLSSLAWSVLTQPAFGSATVSGNGASPTTFIFTPAPELFGTYTFVVQVTDGDFTDTVTVNVTVNAVNDAPVITQGASVSVTMSEDGSPIAWTPPTLGATDIDTASTSLIWSLATPPTKGNVSVSGTGASPSPVLYVPNANATGSDSFVVQVSDGALTDTITVNVTINAVNDAPVITQGASVSVTLSEDRSPAPWIAPTLTASDVETATGSLVWSLLTAPAHGTATVSGAGAAPSTFTYAPTLNYSGADSFVVQVSDSLATATVTVNVTISPVNDAPVIVQGTSLSVTMSEDGAPVAWVAPTLTANDPDNGSGTRIWSVATPAAHGTATVSGTGISPPVFTYVPAAEFSGTDSFVVRVSDSLLADTITVNVTINAVNDAPVITQGASVSVTMSEDASPTGWAAPTLGATDVDSASASLVWSVSTAPAHGTATVSGSGASPSTFSYAPAANYAGADSFVVQVSDGTATDTITVNVTMSAINDAPVINQGASVSVTMSEDGAPTAWAAPAVSVTDPDNGAGSFVWSVLTPPAHGTATVSGTGAAPAVFTFVPTLNYGGTDSFVVQVSDGTLTDSITVNVTINAVNDAPVIVQGTSLSVTMSEDGSPTAWVAPALTANDPDNLSGSRFWSVVTPAAHGTAVVTGTGVAPTTFTYSPAADYAGADSFVVQVSDGLLTDTIIVNVTVSAINDAPVIAQGASVSVTLSEDGAPTAWVAPTVTAADVDNAPAALSWSVLTAPTHGIATVSGSGASPAVFTYAPTADYFGSDSFVVQVSDGTLTDTITVNVTIDAVADAPIITRGTSVGVTLSEDGGPVAWVAPSLVATDVDSPLAGLVWSVKTAPLHGTATVSGSGASPSVLTYAPAANYNGSDNFVVKVSDGALTDQINIIITITPVNDAPVITAQRALSVVEMQAYTLVAGDLTVTDPDNTYPTGFTLSVGTGSNYSLSGATVTPVQGFMGVLNVPVTVNDGTATSNSFNVSITVNDNPLSPAPVVTGTTPTKTPSWGWGAVGTGTYRYKLDSSDFSTGATETTATTFAPATPPADGVHTLYVQSRNSSLEWSLPGSFAITVDNTSPVVAITYPANGVGVTDLIAIEGTTSDALSGAALVEVNILSGTYSWSGTSWTLTATWLQATGPDQGVWFFDASIIPWINNRTYVIKARAKDVLGNVSSLVISSFVYGVVNSAPVITQGTSVSVNMAEDGAPTPWAAPALSATDDGASSLLTWSLATSPAHGTAAVAGSGASPSTFLYSPTSNYNGTDSFVVQVSDGSATDTIIVNVNVAAVNDAPTVTGQAALTTREAEALTVALGSLTVTDIDNTYPTGFTLSVLAGTNYTVNGAVITPAVNFIGTLTVPVKVNDGQADSASFNLSVSVTDNPLPPAPVVTGVTPARNPSWTWTSPSGSGVGEFRIKLDSSDLANGATTTSSRTFTPGTPPSDGAHTLYVQERNSNNEWSASGSFPITVDGTLPTAAIAVPANNATVSAIPVISGTASDNQGVASVEVQVNKGTFYLAANMTWTQTPTWLAATGTTSWQLLDTDLATWATGAAYTIRARAVDTSGNVSAVASSLVNYSTSGTQAYTTLTLELSTQTMLTGGLLTVSGILSKLPYLGENMAGKVIAIEITDPDNLVTRRLGGTDVNGHYLVENIDAFAKRGTYSIKALFEGDTAMYASSSPAQVLLAGSTAGYAILVEGKIYGNEGLDSHNKTTNRIYGKLKKRGFTDDNIYYLNYATTQANVDAAPSKAALAQAITVWAAQRMTAVPAPLHLIYVDHGLRSKIFLYPDEITPADVDGWLTTLKAGLPAPAAAQPVVVVIGACYSGSFMPTLSKPGRILISSAAGDEESYRGPLEEDSIRSGEYFLEEFYTYLERGESLRDAFINATTKTEDYTSRGFGQVTNGTNKYFDKAVQHPLFDDNGDGVPLNLVTATTDDGKVAAELYLGSGKNYVTNSAANPAEFVEVTPTMMIPSDQNYATLWGRTINTTDVSSTWIEVRAPSTVLSGQGGTGQLSANYQKSIMVPASGFTDRWEKLLNTFTEPGPYEIFYFVRDKVTLTIAPMMKSLVYKNKAGNNAPGAFNLTAPANAAKDKTALVFSWQSAVDPEGDPVTYTLEVASDAQFANIAVRKEGIDPPFCPIPFDGGLRDQTTYYWRVRAIDPFGAATWSTETRSFNTDNTNAVLSGLLTGVIFNGQSGLGIPNALISVGDGQQQSQSLAGGFYLSSLLTSGSSVQISAPGFQTTTLTSLDVLNGSVLNLNVALVPDAGLDTTSPTVTASSPGGSFSTPVNLSLTCSDGTGGSGCDKIYYTLDGTEPTIWATVFSAQTPIAISQSKTVKYFAKDLAGNASSVGVLSFVMSKQPQTIANMAFAPATLAFGGTTTVSATGGGSGNAVVFSSLTPAVCSLTNSSLVTALAVGQCTIAANQAGSDLFEAAPQVTLGVAVGKATPNVTGWPTSTALNYGQTLAASSLVGGSASVAGIFSYTTPSTAPNVGTASHSVTFTPTAATNYNNVTGLVSVTVGKAAPVVNSWPVAGTINYGQTLALSTLTGGSATVAGSFAFTAPTTVPNPGLTAQTVIFTPTDAAHYLTVTGSVQVFANMSTTGIALNLPLDGNFNDTSGNSNIVTALGTSSAANRWGVAGKAYTLDAAAQGGSFMKVTDSATLDTDTAFTLTSWVKVNSYGTASSALFSKWLSSTSFGDYMLMMNTNGTLTFTVMNRTGTINTDNVRTTGKLPLGEWAHVAATFNGGDMRVYINGTLAASKVSTTVTATEPTEYTSDDLYLGAFYSGAFRFAGAMDEVRIYSRALNAAEIAAFLDYLPTPTISLASGSYPGMQTVSLACPVEGFTIRYTLDGTIPTSTTGLVYVDALKLNGEVNLRAVTAKTGIEQTSPVAGADYLITMGPVGGMALYLPLDGNLKDMSGKAGTATALNAAPAADRKGAANRAYAFNPAGAGAMNIKVLDSVDLDSDATFTLGAWVKVNAYNASTPSVLFSKWLSAASYGDYTLWINPNGTLSFTVANTDTGVIKMDSVRSATTVPLGVWTHVAATFNNGVMSVYINAVQQGTFTSTLVTHAESKEYNADDLYIGALATGAYKLNGTVDEVRVYNRSLSNAEVSIMSELLPAPLMVPPPGPYLSAQNVALSSPISGFTVRYTTDGSSPTITNGTLYAGITVPVSGVMNITAALFFGDSKMTGDFVGRYTTSFGPADNLALYLAMDGNLNDTSGRNNVVTGYNLVSTADVWGRPNTAYALDQAAVGGSRIKIADSANLDTDTAFTLSAWVKMASYGTSNSVIFSKWLSSIVAGDYIIWVNPNGTISFNIASTETGTMKIDSVRTTATIPLNTWTHVAFTFSNGVMGVHINGTTVSSKTSALVTKTEPKEYGSDDLYIGSMYSKVYPFNGTIDEVRIYGRALTIAEIADLKNGTTGTVAAAAAPLARMAMARTPVETYTAAASTATSSEPLPGETWTDTATGITFSYIPAATFVMGSDSAIPDCDASPAHLVSLSTGYWLAQTEVTQAQWESFMGLNPSSNLTCTTCPVENVTLEEINSYLTKLTAKSGLTYNLPTEAQWEYAARSGGQATLWAGTNNQNEAINFGWLAPNAAFTTHAVSTKLANGLGLNDMNGNVAEWTRDNYLPYSAAPAADPVSVSTTEPAVNVLRGGSYLDDTSTANTFCREAIPAAERSPAAGFRVVVGR